MKHIKVLVIACATLTAAFLAGAAPAAYAQDPGLIFEPGSPSYKEYSIPLEEARRDAGGGIKDSVDSRAFGIGLSRRGGGRSDGSSGDKPGGRRDSTGNDGGRRADVDEPSSGLGDRIAEAEAAGAPFLWGLAPYLLVLLPGVLLALVLARRGGGGGEQPAS